MAAGRGSHRPARARGPSRPGIRRGAPTADRQKSWPYSYSCSYCRSLLVAHGAAGLRLIVAGDKLAAQKLADRRFRDLGDEHVATRALEVGQSGLPAEGVKLAGLDRHAPLDEGTDDLAPALMRQARDGDLGYCRVQR